MSDRAKEIYELMVKEPDLTDILYNLVKEYEKEHGK